MRQTLDGAIAAGVGQMLLMDNPHERVVFHPPFGRFQFNLNESRSFIPN